MSIPWQELDRLRDFFRLEFLFSGLEVSSTLVIVARIVVLTLVSVGVLWAVLKVILKALECLQAFLAGLSKLPSSFFLLLILAAPLSPDSLGARWTGYLLLILALLCLAATAVVLVVSWKYGVDQALRFINTIRRRPRDDTHELREPMPSQDCTARDLAV
ncbi:MAG: hypothetical protein LDL33_14585 [Desulfomonile sp.]|nr:hypothetical protein [Desulfomonile sp.]